MIRARASVHSSEVEISAPAEAVSELARLAHPFIEVAPCPGEESALPAVVVRPTAPAGAGWRRVVATSEYEPDRVLWVDDERRRVAVVGEASGWRAQQLIRSVRHLLRWQAYAQGELLLHGGLVRARETGIAFLGGKRSGKTSSILSAILHAGAGFVSNDDIVITEAGGEMIGYGSPRSMNVRTDSLLALAASVPRVTGLLSGASHPTNGFNGRHRTIDAIKTASGAELPGSVWVRCTELSQVIGCRLLARSRVDAVVFPCFDAAAEVPRIIRLDPGSALPLLSEHIERQASKYDPFLADWFPHTDELRREQVTGRLLREARFYRLTQNMHHLQAATALLLNTVTDPGRRR